MNTRAEFLAGGEGGEVAVPGNIEDSYFLELTASADLDERMPPKGPGVSAEDLKILKQWVKEGMDWDAAITLGSSGWEPQMKPRVVKLPKPRGGRNHPIDRIIDQLKAFEDRDLSLRLYGDNKAIRELVNKHLHCM